MFLHMSIIDIFKALQERLKSEYLINKKMEFSVTKKHVFLHAFLVGKPHNNLEPKFYETPRLFRAPYF